MLRKFLPIATGVAVVFSSITAQPAFADTPGTISPVFVQQHQSRSVRVLVAQSEIKSDINASNLAVVTGGGMLGGLIAAAQNSARARQAEELIAPVRTALLDLDADALALNSARSGLGGVPFRRDRDAEFAARDRMPKSGLIAAIQQTVAEVDAVLAGFPVNQLLVRYPVQVYRVSALQVVYHVVEHFSYHLGQILYIYKLQTATDLGFYSNLNKP